MARLLQLLIVLLALGLPAFIGLSEADGRGAEPPPTEATLAYEEPVASPLQSVLAVLSLASLGLLVHLAVETRQR